MTKTALAAEPGRKGASTDGLRLAGALWVMAGVCCAGLFFVVFVGENLLLQNPGLSALVLGGAIAGLVTGGLLLSRQGPGVMRWSSVVGVAWLIAFGSLTITTLNGPEAGPRLSAGLITGFGLAGALVAYWSGRSGRLE